MAYGDTEPIWRVETREEAIALVDHLHRIGVGASVVAGRRDGSGPFDITVPRAEADFACHALGIGPLEPSGLLAGRPLWLRIAGLLGLVAAVVIPLAFALAAVVNTST